MTKYSGSDLEIDFDTVDISEHGASLDVDESHPAADVTGFTQDDGEYIAGGVTHRKISYAGFDDVAQAVYIVLTPGNEGTLNWYPQGNSTGKPKHAVSAMVTSRKRGLKVGDKVALTAELQFTGAVTTTTVA